MTSQRVELSRDRNCTRADPLAWLASLVVPALRAAQFPEPAERSAQFPEPHNSDVKPAAALWAAGRPAQGGRGAHSRTSVTP